MLRRALLAASLGAVAVLVGVTSARAADTFYFVTGVGDVGGSCSPYPNVPGAFQCTTLRAAVTAANADAAEDEIYLQDGQTYSVNQAIPLTTDVAIFSGNARTTTLQSGSVDRLFTIAQDVNVTIYGLTLKGGNAGAGDGGAIDNAGSLDLFEARVTGNRATNGGGIANEATGTLNVEFSLIDTNHASPDGGVGGGIVNHGDLSADDSTIALNTAGEVGGISSDADTGTSLRHVTVAGNTSSAGTAGISFPTGDWESTGSLFTANLGDSVATNCSTPLVDDGGNIADDASCGFGAGNNRAGLPGPTIQLIDDGGMTDVVDITGTPAKGFEALCSSPVDQRLGQRPSQAPCDAGAYQQGVPAGAIAPLFAFPTPTPSATPPPTPTPTAAPTATSTPTPTPTPVAGKSVVAKPVKGTIRIKRPGTNTFVDLDTTAGIPVGSTVDTRHGTVQLTALQKPGGKTETANFFDGLFKLTQTKTTTDLTLNEPLAPCGSRARAAAAKKKPKTRQLWGDGHGSFRTKGQYSAATVRGTKWLVQDSCAGTLTRVAQGVVSVRDNVRRKTIVLRAGKKYLARPKR